MRIAILGIRGVPANYGGFETFAEQLGTRLVERGHQVTVYGRNASVPAGMQEYRGIRVIRLPAPRSKYFETVVHSLFAAIHAAFRPYDLVYVCNSANVPAVLLLLLSRTRTVLNVDGLEWQRTKWNRLGRLYYRACAALAARLPARLVTDARVIQDYYMRAYGRATDYFPYGTEIGPVTDPAILDDLGLMPHEYVLYVSRLEPENNAHVVIDAYRRVKSDLPLVIVGDAPYASGYIRSLKSTTDPRVRFPGAIYGRGYAVLQSNAAVYVQATEVGGTHPALVEAMGRSAAIVANDVPEHREALGDAGVYYSGLEELAARLQQVLDNPPEAKALGLAAAARASAKYSWDRVTNDYEAWFNAMVADRRSERV